MKVLKGRSAITKLIAALVIGNGLRYSPMQG